MPRPSPFTLQEGRGGDAVHSRLRSQQHQLPPTHPVSTFSSLPMDACSSALPDGKGCPPHAPWLNSRPLGADQNCGVLFLPPVSRLAGLPCDPGACWASVDARPPSRGGVAVCSPRHNGLDLHSCPTRPFELHFSMFCPPGLLSLLI